MRCPAFEIAKGETVLLLGESGSGKSTLLSLICGIVAAQQGHIFVNGTELGGLSAGKRDRFRADQIGVIFQQFNLLPYATVADNIALPLRFAPERQRRAGNMTSVITDLCTALGLPKGAPQMKAGTLSVGQQQRVAVARALIGQPPLIIADEPTSALDAATQAGFLSLLFHQVRSAGTSLLMVSHDARLSEHFDRVVHLTDITSTQRNAT
ncbi:ABC transporter ATP-binding protein [Donghicola sp. XS_ASV15]|uniref:ABC transporter ATP-binding protein n=1 Tax=Donghicola sp. XS_ASV15 TaxID=3241295 RepID=UPI00351157DC